jgi:hypothetical protein
VTRHPTVELTSKRRSIESIDCISASVVVPDLLCCGDSGVRGRRRLEKRGQTTDERCFVFTNKEDLQCDDTGSEQGTQLNA